MKVIIPASGGIDSGYLLVKAVKEYGRENVLALHMDERRPELTTQIKKFCDYIGVNLITMQMPYLDAMAMPDHPLSKKYNTTYWIGYKAYMYVNALTYGTSHGYDQIWFGVYEWNDHFVDELPKSAVLMRDTWQTLYPDCVVPTIEFPLINLTKKDVIKECAKLDFPFHLTYSCFEHNEDTMIHCGVCLGCINRKEEFVNANLESEQEIIDTIKYR